MLNIYTSSAKLAVEFSSNKPPNFLQSNHNNLPYIIKLVTFMGDKNAVSYLKSGFCFQEHVPHRCKLKA